MDLAQALKGGLQEIASKDPADKDDATALYKEYKAAESEEAQLRALKQLVKLLK